MDTLSKQQSLFLSLIRRGIGHPSFENLNDVNWKNIYSYAYRQGLLAVIVDGIDKIKEPVIPQELKLEWIVEVLQDYEGRYAAYEKAIGSLAEWYNQHRFKMMVLKGYACSLDWPKPEHRPCGDIDIWLFGQQREADTELGSWLKVKDSRSGIDSSHHHHTVFDWQGFMVENHYDFINVHHHKSHVEMEAALKELGQDDTHSVVINGERVYLPSPNLHALFLLKHGALHFASSELTLRQVLDWAFFVEKQGKDVDWKWLMEQIEKFGMTDFYNSLNAICVGNLGFNVKIFPSVQFNPDLKERILKDILEPEFQGEEPRGLLPRGLFKYRRWKANGWKHKLCYKESLWSAFWSGVWNHILKPKSI